MANSRVTNVSNQAHPQSGSAHTQRTVSSTAVNVLNHTLQTQTAAALVQFNGADVRVTFDGTTPTASLGFKFTDGTSALWSRAMLTGAKGIRTASTDVIVEIQEMNYL
jgi:hypothetical protein